MNDLQVFQNSEFGESRVLEQDGKPYFPATACAKKLGYINPQKAIRDHCKGVNEMVTPTKGGMQTTRFIPEGDLYRLIVHSKLPAAERFEKWVFDEVLPSIRRTGSYGQPDIATIVAQTANIVCTEMIRQLVPLLQSITAPAEPEEVEVEIVKQHRICKRKRKQSLVDRLREEDRCKVEKLLRDSRYTYNEISALLKQDGISISTSSLNRYAQRENCFPNVDEVSSGL